MEKKKVLIVGASAKEYALAEKFIENNCDVVVASSNPRIKDIAECIDIREDCIEELLEYALENAIDLTIATSELAIKNNIAELFQNNNQLIFAPSASSAEMALCRSAGKRFLYRLKIPTPRFSVYDKCQMAIDYLKNAFMPQVIRTDMASKSMDRLVCTTFLTAKTFTEDLFARGETKVVFEDYVYGHEFTFYVVTDGYHAVHLATVANYKFAQDGNGGILTAGIGAYTPDYKISKDVEDEIMKHVINNVLQALEKKGTPYLGILGIDCVLRDDGKFVVLDFKPFLSDHDAKAVLNLVDENLYTLFEACAIGSFADDYDEIKVSDNSSVSVVLSTRIKGNTIENLDLVESDVTPFELKKNEYLEFETIEGRNFVLTKTSKTLSRARIGVYEDAELINFVGKKYRTDICEQVEKF
jgi:phosphoribosylamine-glycine ligase